MTLSFSDTYRLNNGIEMPRHGFGVYKLTDELRWKPRWMSGIACLIRLHFTIMKKSLETFLRQAA